MTGSLPVASRFSTQATAAMVSSALVTVRSMALPTGSE